MKKEVSYRELMEIVMKDIKEKNNKSGDKFEAKNAMREVADEWKKVKAGNHYDYSAKPNGTPSSSTKTKTTPATAERKDNESLSTSASTETDTKKIRELLELCDKLKEKVLEVLNNKTVKHTIKKTRKTRKTRK